MYFPKTSESDGEANRALFFIGSGPGAIQSLYLPTSSTFSPYNLVFLTRQSRVYIFAKSILKGHMGSILWPVCVLIYNEKVFVVVVVKAFVVVSAVVAVALQV